MVALCMGGVVVRNGRVWDIGMNEKRGRGGKVGSDDEEERKK